MNIKTIAMNCKRISNIVISASMLFLSCNTGTTVIDSTGDTATTGLNGGYATQVEWGEHLVTITGCQDCHTPKKMTEKGPVNDESLMLSGAPANAPLPEITQPGVAATYDETSWVGPWGKSFAANLTPDSTGIGAWSESQFINCLKKGLSKGLEGSRQLMPPMPWQDYSQMSDDEMKAIFAYLKTVKPIHNIAPQYVPPATAGN